MKAVAAMIAALACAAAWGAGFDCERAASFVEKSICADARLSDLDDVLARYYFGATEGLLENAQCLVADEREWLAKRNACKDAACLEARYRERLGELQGLQPGINTQRKLALPEVAQLAWAMAPEPDRIAAPPIASRPATVEGAISEDPGNGFVLRGGDGKVYMLLPDMMRGGASAAVMPSIAKEAKARFSVRGRLAVKDQGHPYFDHRHCILIHRLPAS